MPPGLVFGGLAAIVATLGALIVLLAPPGVDYAAHAYQRDLLLESGLVRWDHLWYAGRYAFFSYSLIYYPVAATLGIGAATVLSAAAGAGAFAVLVEREWGGRARPAAMAFALTWPAIGILAVFPFMLGSALGLWALVALQGGADGALRRCSSPAS